MPCQFLLYQHISWNVFKGTADIYNFCWNHGTKSLMGSNAVTVRIKENQFKTDNKHITLSSVTDVLLKLFQWNRSWGVVCH